MEQTITQQDNKVFNPERWAEGHQKLNYRTQIIVEEVLNTLKKLEEEKTLDIESWTGIRILVDVETVHLTDFYKLSRKIYSRIRWFFPKEGIKMERVNENQVRLILTNPYNFNAKLATWNLNI